MDTSRTNSYVALSLAEIKQRFIELQEDDLDNMSLEDYELESDVSDDAYNPYSRN